MVPIFDVTFVKYKYHRRYLHFKSHFHQYLSPRCKRKSEHIREKNVSKIRPCFFHAWTLFFTPLYPLLANVRHSFEWHKTSAYINVNVCVCNQNVQNLWQIAVAFCRCIETRIKRKHTNTRTDIYWNRWKKKTTNKKNRT